MKSIKVGRIEISYIPSKSTKEEKLEETIEFYKDVTIWVGVAFGLAKIIGGLK